MSTKLFSPSLDLRSEPPNSMAKVLHVGTGNALVSFRGRSYTARMAGTFETGQDAYFVEHPGGVYWITEKQGSWYENPLQNWIGNKRPAQAALEYLLRKCKKWSPFIIGEDADGNPTLNRKDLGPTVGLEGYGSQAGFAALDQDADGKISRAEWGNAGGNDDTFTKLDRNGDGFIDQDEWARGGFAPGGANSYGSAGATAAPSEYLPELPQEEVPECPPAWVAQSATKVIFVLWDHRQHYQEPYFMIESSAAGAPKTVWTDAIGEWGAYDIGGLVTWQSAGRGSSTLATLFPGSSYPTATPPYAVTPITPTGTLLPGLLWGSLAAYDWSTPLATQISTQISGALAFKLYAYYQGRKWGWQPLYTFGGTPTIQPSEPPADLIQFWCKFLLNIA